MRSTGGGVEVTRAGVPQPVTASATRRVRLHARIASRISGSEYGLETARWAADVVQSSPSATSIVTAWAMPEPSLNAVQQGDPAAGRRQYDTLVGAAGKEFLLVTGIAANRLLGLLAHTMDDLDQSAAHFEDALAFCRKGGYRPELAWTCCDYADTFQRNEAGNREKATSLLDESLAISSELGMRPLMERVMSRQDIL